VSTNQQIVPTISVARPLAEPGAGLAVERFPSGAYRVIYVVKFADAVCVLHAFQKKTQKTTRADLDLAMQRYRIARELAEGVKRG